MDIDFTGEAEEKLIIEAIRDYGNLMFENGLSQVDEATKRAFRRWYKENNLGDDPTGAWNEIETIISNEIE